MFSFTNPIGKWRGLYLACMAAFGITALVACGGSSGGGNNSGAGDGGGETDTGGSTENTAPAAAIAAPLDGGVYTYGDAVTFTGSGTDAEDGNLGGDSLAWTSDLDGSVGTGASFTSSDLSWGDHAVTLTATDSNSATGSDSIFISVKAWIHPAGLTDNISPGGEPAYSPQVAMDGNGNAVIAWHQYDSSGGYQIFISEYRSGAWTHPDDLTDNTSPDGQNAVYPRVAMDNNGNAVIAWYQSDGSNARIFKSEYRNGAWTHPAGLTDNISPGGHNAYSPRVAMDGNGNAVIAWYQHDGSNAQIFKSEYRSGAWTYPAGISDNISPDGQNALNPQLAMDGNGNAVIVWQQSDGSYPQIFKSEYRSGAWVHPTDLTDNISTNGKPAYAPQVAMDGNGNAVIVWQQSDGSTSQIFKSEYRSGAWTHPAGISDSISPDGQDAYNPQVAMDNSGNAIITWHQNDGTDDQIFKSEYRNGEWTHPSGISDNISPDGQDADDPKVAMDGDGNAVIAWHQADGTSSQVFISEQRNGAWTHPAGLSDNISPDGQDAYSPEAAMDESGNAVITWYQDDGSNNQIFISEYN